MKIYLATWLFETSQGVSLNKANNHQRLLSYYHSKEKPEEFKYYSKTGANKDENISSKHSSRTRRKRRTNPDE